MRRYLLLTLLLLTFGLTIFAQDDQQKFSSRRLDGLADALTEQAGNLADRTYNDIKGRNSASKSDIDAAFLARQLEGAGNLFRQMLRDNVSRSILRDGAANVADLARRAPGYGSNSYEWRNLQRTVEDISRELNVSGGGGGWDDRGGNDDNRNPTGKVTWRGTVDDEVQLIISNNTVQVRTVTGSQFPDGYYNFTSALPNRRVNVWVNKKKGRGDARVIQQPDRNNNFTTIIQVRDSGSGAKDYEVEVLWR